MGSHRPPPPERNPRLWWPLMVAAVAGVAVPPVVWSAGHVAPKVAADTSLHTFPEQVAEPSAHGGLGGPLAIPSIGVVATGTVESTTNPLSRPVTAARPPSTSTGARPALPIVSGSPGTAAIAIPVTTTPPPVTTTTPAATTTPPTTPPTTTAPTTTDTPTPTQEATTTSATTATTSMATTSEEP